MTTICAVLCFGAFVLTTFLCLLVRTLSRRLGTFDSAPLGGQIKAAPRRVPNTGGIGLFWGMLLPMLACVLGALLMPQWIAAQFPSTAPHLEGLRSQAPMALLFMSCLFALHILGIVDDRRPLGPWLKLTIMALPALAMATFGNTRLLTMIDQTLGLPEGLPIASTLITICWFLIVTNALNFMDNMDGLCAGVAATAAGFFMLAAVQSGQWFVAAALALMLGACLGFLVWNKPTATLFMGDGGSLVLGFMLATLTVRGTYLQQGTGEVGLPWDRWYAVLTPLVVLAVPLYDFCTVTLLRISQGRSPLVGDLQHLSHRLVRRGQSKPAAVATIIGLTAATGFSGLLLPSVGPGGAVLIAAQTVVLLAVIASIEFAPSR